MMCGAAVSSGSPEMKHWRAEELARRAPRVERRRPCRSSSHTASMRSRNAPTQPAAGLEHAEPERREALERAEREEGQERLLHALAQHHVVEELALRGRGRRSAIGTAHDRLEGGVDRDRHVRARTAARIERRRGPGGRGACGVCVNGATKPPRQPSATARSSSAAEPSGSSSVRCAIGTSRPPRVAAEVGDPAVVGALVGERELGVVDLALPEQADRRVEHALVEVLLVEQLRPARSASPAPNGHVVHVAALGRRPSPSTSPIAPSRPSDALAVRSDGLPSISRYSRPVVVDADAQRAVAVARLEVLLPEPGGLEHVPVGVDRAVVGEPDDLVGHRRTSGPSERKSVAVVESPAACWSAPMAHPDLAAEQTYLERAQQLLEEMQARTEGAVAALEAPAREGEVDAAVAQAHLRNRLWSLRQGGGPLCFGRIDPAPAGGGASAFYIGPPPRRGRRRRPRGRRLAGAGRGRLLPGDGGATPWACAAAAASWPTGARSWTASTRTSTTPTSPNAARRRRRRRPAARRAGAVPGRRDARHRRHHPGRAGRGHPRAARPVPGRAGRPGHRQDRGRPPPGRLPALRAPRSGSARERRAGGRARTRCSSATSREVLPVAGRDRGQPAHDRALVAGTRYRVRGGRPAGGGRAQGRRPHGDRAAAALARLRRAPPRGRSVALPTPFGHGPAAGRGVLAQLVEEAAAATSTFAVGPGRAARAASSGSLHGSS